jgi:hypothetical protein
MVDLLAERVGDERCLRVFKYGLFPETSREFRGFAAYNDLPVNFGE